MQKPKMPSTCCSLFLHLCFQGHDAYETTFIRTFSEKLDVAFLESKEGIIFSGSNVVSGMKIRPYLTDQDITGLNQFSTVFLDPSSLTFGVTSVAATSACFFMSHEEFSVYTFSENQALILSIFTSV